MISGWKMDSLFVVPFVLCHYFLELSSYTILFLLVFTLCFCTSVSQAKVGPLSVWQDSKIIFNYSFIVMQGIDYSQCLDKWGAAK